MCMRVCVSLTAYTCPKPAINNGLIKGSAPLYTASCNVGYQLDGEPSIVCVSDNATTSLPKCLGTCRNGRMCVITFSQHDPFTLN